MIVVKQTTERDEKGEGQNCARGAKDIQSRFSAQRMTFEKMLSTQENARNRKNCRIWEDCRNLQEVVRRFPDIWEDFNWDIQYRKAVKYKIL